MSKQTTQDTSTAVSAPDGAGRGIRRLTGPVRAYALDREQLRRYESFVTADFGDPETEHAVPEVRKTAERLHSGEVTMKQTPVVLEDAAGGFIGYCSIHRRNATTAAMFPWVADRYIVAFGRDMNYYRCPLRDGVTYVGETLVRAGLDMIALEAPDGEMPSVSALVLPENTNSRRILEHFQFDLRPELLRGRGQECLWREPGRSMPPALPLDVYIPPDGAPPSESLGRNESCWCGSGQKYKKCHGR